jgi:hypothetical protein
VSSEKYKKKNIMATRCLRNDLVATKSPSEKKKKCPNGYQVSKWEFLLKNLVATRFSSKKINLVAVMSPSAEKKNRLGGHKVS